MRRDEVVSWLEEGVTAVDPEALTSAALTGLRVDDVISVHLSWKQRAGSKKYRSTSSPAVSLISLTAIVWAQSLSPFSLRRTLTHAHR